MNCNSTLSHVEGVPNPWPYGVPIVLENRLLTTTRSLPPTNGTTYLNLLVLHLPMKMPQATILHLLL